MKRRHTRIATALLAAVSTVGGALSPGAAPASAAVTPIAGTGRVVTAGTPLNARSGPSASSTRTGTLRNGATVSIVCRAAGEFIRGTVRNTGYWDRLDDGSYVSDAYVRRRDFPMPRCRTTVPMPAVTGAWTLPVDAGLVSGFRTGARPAHDGVDLGAARNTPIRAAASGTVVKVACNVSSGSCDVDGKLTLTGCGWYVEVLHAGDIVTRYCHMVRRPPVTAGRRVARGAILGHVGSSGSSSGPHLHFEVHNGSPATRANAINPIAFMRARGLSIG
ncbi:peptidoglycan DD-metalloendopeptidase family protein [Actinoplanes sp. NPDC049118]|uniref:peptidoglycan DD-metalloendopeptidase family protein n=1 Tax=Actinoplanes sp. NPDC049118 TaxID=3155769 RepID=UPI0033E82608